MEPDSSLLHLQMPVTCPYPEHQKDTNIPIYLINNFHKSILEVPLKWKITYTQAIYNKNLQYEGVCPRLSTVSSITGRLIYIIHNIILRTQKTPQFPLTLPM